MRTSRWFVMTLIVFAAAAARARDRAARDPIPSHIGRVFIAEFKPVALRPGDQHQFLVAEWVGPSWYDYRDVIGIDVRWTVEPYGTQATIDETGLLRVDASQHSGKLTVYANLNGGQRIISAPVYVHRVGDDLFYDGGWIMTGEIACDGSADRALSFPAPEFRFYADSTYSVTWYPFELYKDYWGPYLVDTDSKKVTFGISYANHRPDDMRGEGSYDIVPLEEPKAGAKWRRAQLRLKNIYFGTPSNWHRSPGAAPCGTLFEGAIPLP